MSELRSKCCGAEAGIHFRESMEYDLDWETGDAVHWAEKYYECSKCHKECEVKEKDKSQNIAFYASLRR